ncbi:MAG: PEP-utilizing enzyme, partial [Candidatus Taylorbacteria bacterium]|nr:PEP-utilizing enzyme [Candidatus Taylorbacteria bacterium]
ESIPEALTLFKEGQVPTILSLLPQQFPKVWNKLKRHYDEWCWTPYNWEGPANTLEYYIETFASTFRQNTDADGALKRIKSRSKEVKHAQNKLLTDLKVDAKHQVLVKIASDIMFLKAIRKDCMYKGAWASEGMYREIGKRLGLTLHEARFIFFFEMRDALLRRKIDKQCIAQRTSEVVLHQRTGKPDKILHGDEALSFVSSLKVKQIDKDVKEIKGQVAYPGKVQGRAKYVNTPDMMTKMEEGDILVAYATQPNLLPAMRKAAAFVTDFGGITCHAAIVAREWKVPCIIGTKIATKVLKDGDMVEVDANKGVVRIIKKV